MIAEAAPSPTEAIREQEYALIARLQDGDERALQELLQLHAGTLYTLKRKWLGKYGIDAVDSCVMLAVWKAAKDFDLSSGNAFMTYCSWKLRGELGHMAKGYQPKEGVDWKSEDGTQLVEELSSTPAPFDLVHMGDESEIVNEALVQLPPRERDIVMRRMNSETLNAIGSTYSLSKERIRQIEQSAHDKLREIISGNDNGRLCAECKTDRPTARGLCSRCYGRARAQDALPPRITPLPDPSVPRLADTNCSECGKLGCAAKGRCAACYHVQRKIATAATDEAKIAKNLCTDCLSRPQTTTNGKCASCASRDRQRKRSNFDDLREKAAEWRDDAIAAIEAKYKKALAAMAFVAKLRRATFDEVLGDPALQAECEI